MFDIMVVDDNANTVKLMNAVLKRAGYNVISAYDGREALQLLDTKHVDLILLDLMMPNMDGLELATMIREAGMNIPMIMITAKGTAVDKRRGFVAGTDDYMVKPVDEQEMLLRISALLRRSGIANEKKLTVGATSFMFDGFEVEHDGKRETLPQKEFLLIYKLLTSPGKIHTRRQLMDEIWDMESETDERTVDVHINRLRDRFRNNSDFEIITVRGLGYKAVHGRTQG